MGLNYIDDYELVNGYAVIDSDFSIITANERMYKFVGTSTKFTIAEIIHQVDIEDFINVANSLRAGQSKSMVLRMKRIDNSYRWVLAALVILYNHYIMPQLSFFIIRRNQRRKQVLYGTTCYG